MNDMQISVKSEYFITASLCRLLLVFPKTVTSPSDTKGFMFVVAYRAKLL